MVERGPGKRNTYQIALGGFDCLADCLRHFLRFAGAETDDAVLVPDDHQRGKREILTALDHFSDAVDRDHLIFQIKPVRIDSFGKRHIQRISKSELKSRFTGGFSQGLHTAVIDISAAVEDYLGNAFLFRTFGNQLADLLRSIDVATIPNPRALLDRGSGTDRLTFLVGNDLRVDVIEAAEDCKTRPVARTSDFFPDPRMNRATNILFRSIGHK